MERKTNSDKVLEVSNLSYSYNHETILEGIDFSLVGGDYLWVIGPNGSGKTTLMKTILGILNAGSGSVKLFGEDIGKFEDWERIAYVPQKLLFFDPYFPATAREVASMRLMVLGGRERRRDGFGRSKNERIGEAFEKLGISYLMNRRIGEISGGQLQRVILARALIANSDIIFLDEPTSAVEPRVREDFFNIIDELNEGGATIVLINHDISGMGINNNKILFINRKQLFFGEGSEFCMSEEMSGYFGSSQHVICHQHFEEASD
ncbi:MAG: metal ABC transporter ATP-binding protein [Deltaproteobacteria bacterium]|uniref:Metal ABC transporter ATP-binding protein n=1 Tax=Candidatus Zymogenus saltonus TaxID=2844893 RepID=A0A9D8KH56_9DELT|nr:metal ABC transporter ATP-binding protein [Candidatus Zymogenus saltonus]